MSRHVVFDSIIVDNCRLGVVLAVSVVDFVVDHVGAVGQLLDGWVHWGVVLGVLAQGPVVLVADVGPADLVVETVALLFHLTKELLLCLLLLQGLYFSLCFDLSLCRPLILSFVILLLFCLFLRIIELIPGVKIGPIGSFPELIQPQIPNLIDNLLRVEPFNNIRSLLWCWYAIHSVPVNIKLFSCLDIIKQGKVSLSVLVVFKMLFLFFKGVQVLVYDFLLFLLFLVYFLVLYVVVLLIELPFLYIQLLSLVFLLYLRDHAQGFYLWFCCARVMLDSLVCLCLPLHFDS